MRRMRMGKDLTALRALTIGLALLLCAWADSAHAQEQAPPVPPPDAIADPPREEPPPPPADEPISRAPDDVPLIDLSRIETEDMRLLYFDPAETYLVPYVGRSFENALAFQQRMFDWEPWDPVTVLLKDFGDYGNAAARASPNNAMLLDIAPLSLAYETFSPGERFYTLTNHEVVHVALMDVWNARDAFWRNAFFGKPMPLQEQPLSILYNYLATPRVNVPRWYLEGSAVFMETWMAGGLGRAQGGYDEMVFRAMVRDDAHFYSPVGLESEGIFVDFQVGVNDYLYGTRFFSYLAYNYTPEQVVQWLRRDPGSEAYYAAQFRQVFGIPLNQAWRDWIAWEHEFQRTNLSALEANPLTTIAPLSPRALGSVSRTYVDPNGNLIGAFRYPGIIGHLGVLEIGSGDIRHLTDIKGAMLYRVTSLAYDPASNTAWYTTDNYAYRDIMEVDVATGRERMLLRDARIGDIVFNPADRSLWGLRHLNGLVTLVRIPHPYTGWNQVLTFPFGRVPFDLDISADGALLSASVGEINGEQSVQVFRTADLLRGGDEPITRFTLGAATPEGFVFSPDSRYLYGSAYYTGVSNIFRFDLQTQQIEAMSNSATGFFRPIPQADGSLIVYEFTGDGFRPGRIQPAPLDSLGTVQFLGAQIAERHPIVTTWTAGSPSRVNLESMITERGRYVPRDEMRIGAAYPIVEGYRGRVAAGYHVVFEDPLQFNQFSATVSYSPNSHLDDDEDWHVNLAYHNLRWRAQYRHNGADFYDLFGPTERSRAGDAFIVGYNRNLIYDLPRELEFDVEAAYYTGLDTLPGAQAIGTQFDELYSLNASLNYTNTTRSLGAVDHERGWRWNVNAGADSANGETFPHIRAGLDFGVPLPMPNSSVWLYTSAGTAGGDDESPLSSFYMGGFGNNYVDDREVKRYRDFDSLPGFDINEIDAQTYGRVMGEVNFPPIRFEDVGIPSLYLSSLRTAVFAGALEAETSSGERGSYQTIGVQADWNFTFAHRLPMTFSIGYAEGFEDGERQGGEVLISLKIM